LIVHTVGRCTAVIASGATRLGYRRSIEVAHGGVTSIAPGDSTGIFGYPSAPRRMR
jgi:hypothetical protein